VARRAFGSQWTGRTALVRGIQELSAQYTARRDGTWRPPPPGPRHAPARILFFTLADLVKLGYLLAELAHARQPAPDPELDPAAPDPLRVLDLGAGYGAQTLAVLALLDPPHRPATRPIRLEAVDRDPLALELLQQLVAECRSTIGLGSRTEVTVSNRELAGAFEPNGPFDLVVAGNLLNELQPDRRLPLVSSLLAALSRSPAGAGRLIVLEPALATTSRELHTLRDALLARGQARVLAPCTRSGPCPALADPGDWCHERRSWRPPPQLQALTRATGLRQGDLRWSYLTLGAEGALPGADGSWRVVGGPIKSKGKLELFLCGEPGRVRAVRLQRHRSPTNRPFDKLRRGCLARIDGGELRDDAAGKRLVVGRDTTVSRWDPALDRPGEGTES